MRGFACARDAGADFEGRIRLTYFCEYDKVGAGNDEKQMSRDGYGGSDE